MLILAAELLIASAAKNALYIFDIKQKLTCYAFVRHCNFGEIKAHKINRLHLTKRLQALPRQTVLSDALIPT